MANLLRSYKSISRPSIGSSSSYSFSSLVKKQSAAEDAIIENQYADGLLSPERYKENLQTRLNRTWNTPLQVVTLQEKVQNVDEKLNDVAVDRAYQSGQITTQQVRDYEKAKLDRMTEPGSAAYIKQSQKVSELIDKTEKETRTQTRNNTALSISKMPDDSSAKLWEKARLYTQLTNQSRLDGDIQAATTYETQANNYTLEAKKADITDTLSSTRLSVSKTPDAGLGIPSAEGGLKLFSQLSGAGTGASGTTGGTGVPSSGATLSPTTAENPIIKNALESLDSKKKSYDRTAQSLTDTNSQISAYQQAIQNAPAGDFRNNLQIALNNLNQTKANLENSLAKTQQEISDTAVLVQEKVQKLSVVEDTKRLTLENQKFGQDENNLERDFAAGKLGKDQYLIKAAQIAADKRSLYEAAYSMFTDTGNEGSANSYLDKMTQTDDLMSRLQDIANNFNDYEMVRVDKSGNSTNIFGRGSKSGDVMLTNVRQLKDSGNFDANYVNINGVYHRVYPEGGTSEVTGLPLSSNTVRDLARANGKFFTYMVDNNGQVVKKEITMQNQGSEDQPLYKPMLSEEAAKILENKAIAQGIAAPGQSNVIKNFITKTIPNNMQNNTIAGAINQSLPGLIKKGKDFAGKAGSFVSNALGNVGDIVKNFFGGVSAPITQAFGVVNPSIEKFSKGGVNYGTDFGVPVGTGVYLPDGRWKVVEAFGNAKTGYLGDRTNRGYGNSILVQNLDTGEKLRFSHLSQVGVGNGQILNGGISIAKTGASGNVTGPHLDLEYYDSSGRISNVLSSKYAQGLTQQHGEPVATRTVPLATSSSRPETSNFINKALGAMSLVSPVKAAADENVSPSAQPQQNISSNNRLINIPGGQPININPQNFKAPSSPNITLANQMSLPQVSAPSAQLRTSTPSRPTFSSSPSFQMPKLPTFNIPNIQSVFQRAKQVAQPVIQRVQQTAAPVLQRVQQAAAPVVNTVKNAISSISNWFRRK